MWMKNDPTAPARPSDESSEKATTGRYRILWVVATLVVGLFLPWRIYQWTQGSESLHYSLATAGWLLASSSRLLSRRRSGELLLGLGLLLIVISELWPTVLRE